VVEFVNKKKYYKKIFNYFKAEKKLIIVYFILSFVLVAFNTLTPVLSAKNLTAITNTNLDDMFKYALLILIVSFGNYIVSFFNNLCGMKIHDNVELKIKTEVSKEIFDLEIKNFDTEGTGFFINRIEREPGALSGVFTRVRYSLTGLLTSIGVFIYVFWTSPFFGIFFLLVSLLLFFLSVRRTKYWEKERKTMNEFNEKYSSNFSELIRGIKDIKVLNLKNILIKKTTKEQKEIINYTFDSRKNDEKFYILDNAIRYLIDFALIILGIILIKNNYLTGANFLVIFMYQHRAIYLIDEISDIYRNIKDFNISLERLYEIIDGSKYPKEKFGNKNIPNFNGSIEFRNTKFGYDNNEVLKGINFKINKNETIGIVGKSGVGKTTIFNLINKLYSVSDGEIFLDGIDINELDENTIRSNISTITQNPYIFNMSIKDNLKLVNPRLKDKEMVEKCRLCLLDEYVNNLDKKYDTLVGENGVILSGGLKQRLAIARALVKNSKIILLDEATSSLDNETQDYIHNSIKKIRNDYTILIIAHRLSTVIDCDKILVIDDGKVVGFDSHENLIKNNNIYKKLYQKELS